METKRNSSEAYCQRQGTPILRCPDFRNNQAGLAASVRFSREFVQPDINRRALLGVQLSEHDAHAESGVRINDGAGKFTGAAAVANAESNWRVLGKRVERIDIAAARAQFRNARGNGQADVFRLGDE